MNKEDKTNSEVTYSKDELILTMIETIVMCFAMFFSVFTLTHRTYIEAIISAIMVVACMIFACFLELKSFRIKK